MKGHHEHPAATTMTADLIGLVEHLGAPHVLVVRDLILDRYGWGTPSASAPRRPSWCCAPTAGNNAWAARRASLRCWPAEGQGDEIAAIGRAHGK
jgi:hypothetical protein